MGRPTCTRRKGSSTTSPNAAVPLTTIHDGTTSGNKVGLAVGEVMLDPTTAEGHPEATGRFKPSLG
ncbi:MAG: hypothetical protein JSS68_02500 [Actinobacteria bacterium]|nr:hypothetical protein [Actinomycetota bacterium]